MIVFVTTNNIEISKHENINLEKTCLLHIEDGMKIHAYFMKH